jgi:uncharacterized protein involved in exopolysaccharide biosynthesis
MPTTLYQVLHVLFKRKSLIGLALLLILGPALVAAMLRPTVYRAASRIMVTQARAYPQLSPQEERRNVPVNDTQFVAATAQTLATRAFLREVAGVLVEGTGENGDHGSVGWWEQHLARRLEVTPLSNAPLIEVAYRGDDPERAAHVVNTVIQQYVRYEARAVFDNPALREFYERRRDELQVGLGTAEQAFSDFQRRHDIYALETQKEQLARAHVEALRALDLNAGQIRQAETEALALATQLEKLPAQVALHTYGDNPRLSALNTKVVQLELQLNDLRQLYTDEDRRVKDTLEQLARAEDLLLEEEASFGSTPTMTRLESNDAYQNILENSLREEASAAALRARRDEIERTIEATATRLRDITTLGFEFERLQAEVNARQASFTQLLTLLEQARTSEALDNEGFTNIRIVDRATVPSRPLPTRRSFTLALGLLASLAVGIGFAFGMEAVSPTVHAALDAEQRLALPVVGVIPEES